MKVLWHNRGKSYILENKYPEEEISNKVAEEAYKDILSNPGKKIGEALGTIMNIGNTLLWPVKWANERTRIYFENNLKKYSIFIQVNTQDFRIHGAESPITIIFLSLSRQGI